MNRQFPRLTFLLFSTLDHGKLNPATLAGRWVNPGTRATAEVSNKPAKVFTIKQLQLLAY